MKTRSWNILAVAALVGVLIALTAPLSVTAAAVTNAYWTGNGQGYTFGAGGVGLVADRQVITSSYNTGLRDGYISCLAVNRANPNVTIWPTASAITYGQTLASSTLSGGSATPAGSFAFTTPSAAPNAGTALQSVTYTPTDTTNYNIVVSSVSVTVYKADQAITSFPSIPDQLTTNSVGLAATASSGLAVSFTTNGGPATITGNTNLAFAGTGVVNIVAAQAGDGNWNAAPSLTNTFNVTKVTAGVILKGLSQTYNGSARIVTATTVPLGLTVDVVYDGSGTAPTNVGSYAVTGTVNDAMYQGVQTGTLVVAKANQAITFPPIVDQLLNNKVGLSATADSGLPVSFGVLSGLAVIDNFTNLSFTGAGQVVVVASQAGDGNWNAAPDATNTFRVWGLYTLAVQSCYGTATPIVGTYTNIEETVLTNSVTTPVPNGSATQFMCTGWAMTGNDPSAGNTNWFMMTVTNNATLTWFWSTNYWLDTTFGPHGTVNVGAGWQVSGVTTSITAIAEQYYHFTNWTGDASGNVNPLNVLMDGSKSVTASFAENLAPLGTPEWWLAGYGLTNDGSSFGEAETNDTDGDGFTAAEEWIADTVPTNRDSYLHLTFIQCTNSFAVTFSCTNSRVYSLQSSEGMVDGQWLMVDGATNRTGEADGMLDLVDPDNTTSRFYRIDVHKP